MDEAVVSEILQTLTLPVGDESDIVIVVNAVRKSAHAIGFSEKQIEELVIVAKELATNIIKHAKSGKMILSELSEKSKQGVCLETLDSGPGIADIEFSIADGVSTTGSLGVGLGTVNRIMDELEISSQIGNQSGTRVFALKWKRGNDTAESCPLDIGVASRPHPRMAVNGDAYYIKKYGSKVLLSVIDGIGHGQFAHRASSKARRYLESHYEQPLELLFRGVNRECRATRGVVMALVRIDWKLGTMQHASLGNIETRLLGAEQSPRFMTKRGIIGQKLNIPHVTEHKWQENYILTLFSDGIQSHWNWNDFDTKINSSSDDLCRTIIRKLSRDNDDATILIIKGRRYEE